MSTLPDQCGNLFFCLLLMLSLEHLPREPVEAWADPGNDTMFIFGCQEHEVGNVDPGVIEYLDSPAIIP